MMTTDRHDALVGDSRLVEALDRAARALIVYRALWLRVNLSDSGGSTSSDRLALAEIRTELFGAAAALEGWSLYASVEAQT